MEEDRRVVMWHVEEIKKTYNKKYYRYDSIDVRCTRLLVGKKDTCERLSTNLVTAGREGRSLALPRSAWGQPKFGLAAATKLRLRCGGPLEMAPFPEPLATVLLVAGEPKPPSSAASSARSPSASVGLINVDHGKFPPASEPYPSISSSL
jgi:hypothetical protein